MVTIIMINKKKESYILLNLSFQSLLDLSMLLVAGVVVLLWKESWSSGD